MFEFWAVRLFDFEPVQVTLGVEMEKRPARGSDSAPKLPKVAYLFVVHAIAVFVDEFLHLDGPILAALHRLYRHHWIEIARLIRVHEARDGTGHLDCIHRVCVRILIKNNSILAGHGVLRAERETALARPRKLERREELIIWQAPIGQASYWDHRAARLSQARAFETLRAPFSTVQHMACLLALNARRVAFCTSESRCALLD